MPGPAFRILRALRTNCESLRGQPGPSQSKAGIPGAEATWEIAKVLLPGGSYCVRP